MCLILQEPNSLKSPNSLFISYFFRFNTVQMKNLLQILMYRQLSEGD